MISAKVQVDSVLKSNKIVVFFNEKTKPDSDLIKRADKINLINNRKTTKRQTETKNSENNEIIKLLELYGIQKKHITLIAMNQLKNSKICEMYLKAYYCNNQDVKYPLVFMHGIYFGSNDEIVLAHSEGFLFELFKDTGLYNMSLDALMNNDFDQDYDDYEEEGESIDNEFINDDEDTLAIDKVAKFNLKKMNILKKSKLSQSKRTWEYGSLNECNSDYSSLYSINKQSYCQNYIDNNTDSISKSKNSISEKTDDSENNSEDSDLTRRITPPGEILATINKWALRTKDAIEKRNKQIIKKSNF